MVLTLKAKEGLRATTTPFEVGQSGLIGNHATRQGVRRLRRAVPGRHRLPLPGVPADGKTVIQLDLRGAHIGRRTPVDLALVGDAGLGLQALLPLLEQKTDTSHLDAARKSYDEVAGAPAAVRRPGVRPQAEGAAAPQGRQPRRPDPPRAARRGDRPARRRRRDLHHRHRDVDGLALPVRADDRQPAADRLLQPRLDGQRDAAGARRQRARPAAGRSSRSAATAGSRCCSAT